MDAVRKLILENVSNLSETSKKIGKNHAYLHQFLHRNTPVKLPEDVREALAAEIGVHPDQLRFNQKSSSHESAVAPGTGSSPNTAKLHPESERQLPGESLVGDRDLPVFSTTEGGRGTLILTSEAVDWVVRPDPLLRVKDGYGLIVADDSMSPAHRSGSIVLVNPHIPWRAGDLCVFRQVREDKTEIIAVRELRRWTDTTWHVRQYKPDRDYTLKRAEWPACHVAVGNYVGR
jgi:phage repressor protein C with HTH and peptisase S24 domain